ncbi:copper chaperone PCu(A)C [Kytococcus sedentarius]|uniref:copper chaperone PCu(A)C n=1 Tax=Kytococcus sedentarius TaxID=1276 RepID=UPI0035BC0359
MTRTLTTWVACALTLTALTACSGEGASDQSSAPTSSGESVVPSSSESPSSASPSSVSPSSGAPSESRSNPVGALTLSDGWVKATDEGMTAVFGRLQNPLPVDLRLVSGSTEVAKSVELHEVADGQMQEVEKGMTVPAGEILTLEPGGLHIMLMGVSEPIVAGDEVTLTLEDAEGGTHEFTVPARTFDGGDEDYAGDGHDHSH